MKYIYLVILIFLVGSLNAQYCVSKSTHTSGANKDENIGRVTFGTIDNITTCGSFVGSQGTGTGIINAGYVNYTDFTNSNVPVPVLTFGASYSFTVNVLQCDNGNWTNSGKVFIDWNQDFDFADAGEEFLIYGSVAGAHSKTISITIPTNALVGPTRMRVSVFETSAANIGPCSQLTWGEVEDYKVFVGQRKYDYEATQMTFPDSLSFCGDAPIAPSLKVTNVGNQDLVGGVVQLQAKGLGSSTTNIFLTKVFSSTIAPGGSYNVVLDPTLFSNDEPLEFTYNVYNPQDTLHGNDTLRKTVLVYKTPTFTVTAPAVCFGDSTIATVSALSRPSFIKWDNQSILDSTKYLLPASRNISVEVSRGWKCTKVVSVPAVIKPLPTLIVSNDTTLCKGQYGNVSAYTDATKQTMFWNDAGYSSSPSILVPDERRHYVATVYGVNGCINKDSVFVDTVMPPFYSKVLDTVCKGEMATIGFNVPNGFLFDWDNMEDNTPLIHPYPTKDSIFNVILSYNNCHQVDQVNVKVNSVPNLITKVNRELCPNEIATVSVSGAKFYNWSNNLGTTDTVKVAPATTTIYTVTGIDSNNCKATMNARVVVNPRPTLTVYSNKYLDNVCLGDSAILYSNGAKTYSWDIGSSDSVLRVKPTITQQYKVIGTTDKGCVDSIDFRLTVKSALSVKITGASACEGDAVILKASGGATYNWGAYGTDSFTTPIVAARTSSYTVTVTSAEKCQIIAEVLLEVQPKPKAQSNSITLCKGENGTLEATGGSSYYWATTNETTPKINVNPTTSQNYMVVVSSSAGCKDTTYGVVTVIEPRKITFKSPVHVYECPNLPVTLSATPVGGIFSGPSVKDNIFTPKGLVGEFILVYTIREPINNCKEEDTIHVKVLGCSSAVSNITSVVDANVYPNPFSNKINLDINSKENAEGRVTLYDFSGRKVVSLNRRIVVGDNHIEINDIELSNGIYFLELETENVNRQFKIVKQ